MSTPSQQNPRTPSQTEETPSVAAGGEPYPPQLHAGAVGYGPNYKRGPGIGDKFDGLKEEIKGKVTHKPELVQHGRDMRTGAQQEKDMNDDAGNPFKSEEDDQSSGAPTTAGPGTGAPASNAPRSTGGNVHGEDAGAAQQAASVAPEGTEKGAREGRGEAVLGNKVIDESS